MKKTLITIITVLLISATSFAQQPVRQGRQMTPEARIKKQTERMVEDLSLTEDQTLKVQALNEKYGEKMGEIFQNAQQGDREQMREKMDSLRTTKDAELKEVLTDEQFKKHQKIQEERMERIQQMRKNRQGDGDRPERRGKPRGDN